MTRPFSSDLRRNYPAHSLAVSFPAAEEAARAVLADARLHDCCGCTARWKIVEWVCRSAFCLQAG